MSGDPPSGRPRRSSRRGFLSLLGTGALATVAGCGYRPGGGDVRWRSTDLRGVFRASQVGVAGDVLYTIARSDTTFDFESEEWYRGGRVTAYGTTDGEQRWSEHFESHFVAHAVDDGGAAVASEGTVVRLGPDGTEWSATVDEAPAALALADDRVYARTAGRSVVALDDGERVGSVSLAGVDGVDRGTDDPGRGADSPDGRRRGTIEASGGLVVAADEGGVVAFDVDGRRRWRRGDVAASRLTVARDSVLAVTGRYLLSLDAVSGETRWRTGPAGTAPPPVATADAVYYVPGSLVVLDRAGDRRWSTDAIGHVGRDPPVAVDGSGVYTAERTSLSAFDHDGTRRWTVGYDAVEAGPFPVDAGVLAVADGDLVCHVR